MAGTRQVLLFAVAAGLVLMHHLIGAHQHTPEPAMPSHHAVAAPASSGAALLHDHDGGHDAAT